MYVRSPTLHRRDVLTSAIAMLTGIGGCGGGGATDAPEVTNLEPAPGVQARLSFSEPWPLVESTGQGALDVSPDPGSTLIDPRSAELAWLRNGVADDLLPVSHIEVPALANLRALQDTHGQFLGLRTHNGQVLKNNGVRAQVSVDFPYVEGETIRYSWRFAIGNDFRADAPANRWWLFADWHSQPDPRLGQTWDAFPSLSSPIGLGYGRINGQDLLALFYGAPTSSTVGLIPFSRGVWHQIVVEITWSRTASGRAAVYLDDAAVAAHTATGTNMHNAYQHYLKVGSYRHPEIAGDVWVNVRNVAIRRVV